MVNLVCRGFLPELTCGSHCEADCKNQVLDAGSWYCNSFARMATLLVFVVSCPSPPASEQSAAGCHAAVCNLSRCMRSCVQVLEEQAALQQRMDELRRQQAALASGRGIPGLGPNAVPTAPPGG